jgi:hypothetical protein
MFVGWKTFSYIFAASKPAAQSKPSKVVPPGNTTFARWVAILIELKPAARMIAATPRHTASIFAAVLSTSLLGAGILRRGFLILTFSPSKKKFFFV